MSRPQILDKLNLKDHQLKWLCRSYKIKPDFDSVASVLYLKKAGLTPREIRKVLPKRIEL